MMDLRIILDKKTNFQKSIVQKINHHLIFGMHNPHMEGSKVTNQIFDILPRR